MSRSIGAAESDSLRPLTIRERLDIRAGLRRETERDRVRLARERDLSLRRMRMREELSTQGADRFISESSSFGGCEARTEAGPRLRRKTPCRPVLGPRQRAGTGAGTGRFRPGWWTS